MGNLQEIDKLDRAMKDAEIRLKSIRHNLEKIDHEITVLEPLQKELEENIEFLKRTGTIPMAQEFRKTKQELAKTKARLGLLLVDRPKVSNACDEVESIIHKFRKDIQDLILSDDKKVLKFQRGNKNG